MQYNFNEKLRMENYEKRSHNYLNIKKRTLGICAQRRIKLAFIQSHTAWCKVFKSKTQYHRHTLLLGFCIISCIYKVLGQQQTTAKVPNLDRTTRLLFLHSY